MNLWEEIKKELSDGFQTVAGKTSEYTRIGRIKIDVLGIKKEIEEKFIELGGRVYQQVVEKNKKSIDDDMHISQLILQIRELEQELKKNEKDMHTIKKDVENDFEERK